MEFPALKEAQGKLEKARADLADVFKQAGPELDVKKVKGIEGDVVEYIRAKNDEIEDLAKEVEGLKAVAHAAESVKGFERGDVEAKPEAKDFGSLFVASNAYARKGAEAHIDVEVKTLMTTSAGWAPETTRSGLVVDKAERPVQVTDIFPQGTISQAANVYMEETVFTNAAGEVDEGGTYQEATLQLAERSDVVRKIAVWLPVTDEQLEDESAVLGYINRRLPFMLRQKLDSQLLNGTGAGTPTQLNGVLSRSGIQTQAKGTDAAPDAIYKALNLVEVNGRATPDFVVIHSTDWQNIRLLRTTDGVYIWGNPADAGPQRIWGLPVVKTQVLSAGTALVGDFGNFSELLFKRGIDVQVSNAHDDFFVNGKQAIRADVRCVLSVYRPAAFATVTGL